MTYPADFFRFFGRPVLFFIKIILYTVNLFLSNLFHLIEGIVNTIIWFAKLIKLPKINKPNIPIPDFHFSILNSPFSIFIIGFISCFIFIFIPYEITGFLRQLPNPRSIQNGNYPVTTKIYDRNRVLLYEIYTGENRTPVKLSQLPSYVVDAHLAAEDRNFYQHMGFDPLAITRAAVANFQGKPVQGGSTITQQLVKFSLLTPERTILRKIKEVILAFWTEIVYSKQEILEMYLNNIPYGGSAYGIEAAAKTYFGKSAKNLSLAEASLLAGLPSAPSIYSPFGVHPELARERQFVVLKAMGKENAAEEKLNFISPATQIKAPHFVMYVKDLLVAEYGIKTVEQGGLEIITTLDYELQKKVQAMVSAGVEKQRSLNVGNGAAVVTNPANGEILAMVGSKDYFNTKDDGNVNVTLAQRSPGSSIKVVTYAAVLEKGIATPSAIIDDAPVNFIIPGQPVYSPKNYDNKWHGKVTLRTALGSSYNVPAVKLLSKLGVANLIDFGRKMGIKTWEDESRFGLSLTLGGGEVTMLDMAEVYGTLANNGARLDLNPIISIKNYKGQQLEADRSTGRQVISNKTAQIMTDILSDNTARAPAFGTNSPLVIPNKKVAVKTGTAETKRDNWTIGYTPDYVVAVWVGNNNNSPMSPHLESGSTGAAAIWHEIMVDVLK